MNFIRAVFCELLKMKSQKKSYVMIGGHLLFLALCYIGFRTTTHQFFDRINATMEFKISNLSAYLDGPFFARVSMVPTFIVLMPILIATLAGDTVAGEMQDGTLKLYLSRPRSRTLVILSKFTAVYLAELAFCIYFSLAGLAIGIVLFGISPTQLLMLTGGLYGTDFVVMTLGEALFRYFAATLYFSFSLMALGSIALFCSTVFNRMTSATVTVITVYFVSYIAAALPFCEKLRPWLISEIMNNAFLFWLSPMPWEKLASNLAALSLYITGFLVLAVLNFNAKDIR